MPKRSKEGLQDPRSSRKARGLRLKSIRQSLHLSRRAFSERFTVSVHTLQNWETSKNGGLGEDRAHQLIKMLKLMGVQCAFEWLMFGIGPAPTIVDPFVGEVELARPFVAADTKSQDDERTSIAKELQAFRENYPHRAIDMIVADDGMEPRYIKNEYVAGLKRTKNQIATIVGKDCVVQTEDGDVLLRQVKKSEIEGCYTLVCINPHATVSKPIIYDAKLVMAAPVIWTRREDKSH